MEVVDVTVHEDGHYCLRPICEFCGCEIDRLEKRCAALDDGRCRP
jgi:hypothetical protein